MTILIQGPECRGAQAEAGSEVMPPDQNPLVPTPAEFLEMTLDEIAAISTRDLIRIADVYVWTAEFGATALTTRETKSLKSSIRVIVQELHRRSSTDDSLAPLLRKYLS